VAEFVRRSWRVSTIKHAHHDVDVDQPGRDSFRHRISGSMEVAVVSGRGYAIMREEAELALADVLARLAPADLVLIEGYKREAHPKIEVRAGQVPSLAAEDPNVVAIASDVQPAETHLPWFRRDDIAAIADFIVALKR